MPVFERFDVGYAVRIDGQGYYKEPTERAVCAVPEDEHAT
jgi:hypothetical protein